MAGKLPMGSKELVRAKIMSDIQERRLTMRAAAIKLKISERQAKRILARYRSHGAAGLLHGNQGQPSHNGYGRKIRTAVMGAYKEFYCDFGPTLAAEKLWERQGLKVDHETLRRWLIADGLWTRKRRRSEYRSRRTRRECFGELVQFDGSHHDWFEGRGPACCLMNMVDDATGTTLAFFCEQETTEAAMRLLWRWIELYGIPQALYCDRKNAFVIDREPTLEEQLAGITPMSPFQLACQRLGIELIVAHSPQAKGRVERNHGVYQDRCVKELRLAGVSTILDANSFLETTYLPAINAKFAKQAARPQDAHVPLSTATDLRDIFCFQEQRVVSRDWVIQFQRRLYQIRPHHHQVMPRPNDRVVVRKWLDCSVHFYWQNKPLPVEEIQSENRKEDSSSLYA
jgi:hypothetical protein